MGVQVTTQCTATFKRKFRVPISSDAELAVTGNTLKLPDGARILRAKFLLMNGRKLRVTAQPDNLMIGTDASAPKAAMARENIAPYNRFAVVTVNIPDTIARAIDNTGTNTLFNVQGFLLNSGTTWHVEVEATCAWEANIYS